MKFENKGKWIKEAEEKEMSQDIEEKEDITEEDEISGELDAEVESDEFIDELDRPEEEEDAIELSEGCHRNEANEDFVKDVKEIISYANKTYKDLAKASPTTKYDPSFNAIKDFSMNDMDDGSYMIKFGSGKVNTALLDKAMRKAITNAKVSKKRSLGNIGTKMFIYESSQKNEADPNAERTLIAKKKEIQKLASKMGDDNLVQYLSLLKKYVDDAYDFAVKHFSESSQKNEGGIARIRKLGPKSVWKGPMYKENEYMVALYNTDMDFRRGISFFSNPKNRTLSKQDAISYVKEKWPGYKIVIEESSQKNEDGTSWKAVLELRAPSSMNNKAVEDKLEKVIEQNGMTVLDVTAERK